MDKQTIWNELVGWEACIVPPLVAPSNPLKSSVSEDVKFNTYPALTTIRVDDYQRVEPKRAVV